MLRSIVTLISLVLLSLVPGADGLTESADLTWTQSNSVWCFQKGDSESCFPSVIQPTSFFGQTALLSSTLDSGSPLLTITVTDAESLTADYRNLLLAVDASDVRSQDVSGIDVTIVRSEGSYYGLALLDRDFGVLAGGYRFSDVDGLLTGLVQQWKSGSKKSSEKQDDKLRDCGEFFGANCR